MLRYQLNNGFALGFVCIVTWLFLTQIATSQTTTYTYAGTSVWSGFGGYYIFGINCPIAASFTTPNPIPPNVGIPGGALYVVTTSSYAITDCLGTLATNRKAIGALEVATDGQGQIYAWAFGASGSQKHTVTVSNGVNNFPYTATAVSLGSTTENSLGDWCDSATYYDPKKENGFEDVGYTCGAWTGGGSPPSTSAVITDTRDIMNGDVTVRLKARAGVVRSEVLLQNWRLSRLCGLPFMPDGGFWATVVVLDEVVEGGFEFLGGVVDAWRSWRSVSSAKQRSTRLIHEAEMSVKCG